MRRVLLSLVLGLLVASPAMAAKLALVIGNGGYQYAGELANTRSDADAFTAFLKTTGFTVSEVKDGTRAQMAAALDTFTSTLRSGDTAVFYYAGHGMQLNGENYLVGVEAQLNSVYDVPSETVGLSDIISNIDDASDVAMFFIDACRDDPLADRLARKTRGITRGLAPVQSGDGAMVAFAASPGQVAFDGVDGHSAFTRALVDHLGEPGIEVGTAFKRVIRDVRAATLDKQLPQLVSSLSAEFYFRDGGGTVADQTPAPATPSAPASPAVPETADLSSPPSVPEAPVAVAAPVTPDVIAVTPDVPATVPLVVTAPAPATPAAPAAPQQSAADIIKLADAYESGEGQVQDRVQAAKLYQQAADLGDPIGIRKLGLAYRGGNGVGRDLAKAVDLLTQAADAGDPPAMRLLAYLIHDGRGTGADPALAHSWLLKAGAASDVEAMASLVLDYSRGDGVAASKPEALHWLDSLRSASGPRADGLEGYMRMFGISPMTKNAKQGLEQLIAAATLGDRFAMGILGYAYAGGVGVKADDDLAYKYGLQAANAGNPLGDWLVAYALKEGEAVKADPDGAAEKLYEAILGGYDLTDDLSGHGSVSWGKKIISGLQQQLKDGGYYDGAVDGSYGPAMGRAIKAALGDKPTDL